MSTCGECGSSRMKEGVLPEFETDLGGITVRLMHAVIREECEACGEWTIEIPDLPGLIRAAALARAMLPFKLSGKDVKFMRKALDMTGKEFADTMELTPETVSRWENNDRGIGGYTEKLLRHNICSLLYKRVKGVDYQPELITTMRIIPVDEGFIFPAIQFIRMLVSDQHGEPAWFKQQEAA